MFKNLFRSITNIITYKEARERFIDGFYVYLVITDSNAQAERLYYSSRFFYQENVSICFRLNSK